MATHEKAPSNRAARAQKRAAQSPNPSTPTRSKRSKTSNLLTLDTGDGGQVELATANVRVATGSSPAGHEGDGLAARLETSTATSMAGGSARRIPTRVGDVRSRSEPTHGRQLAQRYAAQGNEGEGAPDDGDGSPGSEDGGAELGPRPGDGSRGRRTEVPGWSPSTAPAQRPAPPPPAAPAWTPPQSAPPATPVVHEVVREFRKPKKMRLPKFKGLDGTMSVSTWLRAVQTETRRQERTLGVQWEGDEIYYEMASNFEGEALRWYGNVVAAIGEETHENLARLLRGRYGEQRSDPEVVASMNDRKQMMGEPLVEYAATLREIVADRSIGEEWLVDAFLNGMSNPSSATHIRGREPETLDDAVRIAIRQVGKFGEGHRVGLEAAMAMQNGRRQSGDSTPHGVAAPLELSGKEQLGATGNVNKEARGFMNTLPLPKPPRYDVDGRLVSPLGAGSAGWGTGMAMVPPRYTLVPVGTQAAMGQKPRTQKTSGVAQQQRSPISGPPHSGDGGGGRAGRRGGRTLKVEGSSRREPLGMQGGSRYGPQQSQQPLRTREERLANYRRYQGKLAQRTPSPQAHPEGRICFYCRDVGHFARDCELKQQDLAAATSGGNRQTVPAGDAPTADSGNDQQA